MNNQQTATVILERLTLMHGDTIDGSHAWLNHEDKIDSEGWKIERAYELITEATRTCVTLGDIDAEDTDDTWHMSDELDALIDTIAARIDLGND